MYTRSLSNRNHSFFLLGPRGTGKSTWLKKHPKDSTYINLLDEGLYKDYLGNKKLDKDGVEVLPIKEFIKDFLTV